MTSQVGEVVFDYSSFDGRYVIGSGLAEFETMWSKASNGFIHVYNDPQSINGVALDRNTTSIHGVSNAEALNFTSQSRCLATGEIAVLRNTNGFYAAVHMLDINLTYSVRRGKAPSLSGCEPRPATVAPAGSNRSG